MFTHLEVFSSAKLSRLENFRRTIILKVIGVKSENISGRRRSVLKVTVFSQNSNRVTITTSWNTLNSKKCGVILNLKATFTIYIIAFRKLGWNNPFKSYVGFKGVASSQARRGAGKKQPGRR